MKKIAGRSMKAEDETMIINEYNFSRNIPVEDFFSLMVKTMDKPAGWRFEVDGTNYSMVWTPTLLINAWRLHPKVAVRLESVSEEKTVCRITTANSGLFDPFKTFKRFHGKIVDKFFHKIKQQTLEYERMPAENRKKFLIT